MPGAERLGDLGKRLGSDFAVTWVHERIDLPVENDPIGWGGGARVLFLQRLDGIAVNEGLKVFQGG